MAAATPTPDVETPCSAVVEVSNRNLSSVTIGEARDSDAACAALAVVP